MTAPTRAEYRAADRLLKARTEADPYDVPASLLRCWIEDSKPARTPDLARLIFGCIALVAVLAVVALLIGTTT